MIREGSLEEISDGKLYIARDMVRAGCQDCEGCSYCCRKVGDTLLLDPYDIYELTKNLGISFEGLLETGKLELGMADGIALPHIAIKGEACGFLDEKGRCGIHSFRPGLCRLFPLGRYYEDGGFKYILQKGQCVKESRTKVKIKSFLGIEDLKSYEEYITDWHYYIKGIGEQVKDALKSGDDTAKKLTMGILQTFYIKPYTGEDFYKEYYARRKF